MSTQTNDGRAVTLLYDTEKERRQMGLPPVVKVWTGEQIKLLSQQGIEMPRLQLLQIDEITLFVDMVSIGDIHLMRISWIKETNSYRWLVLASLDQHIFVFLL
jgi:hypothetical protein